MLRTSQAIVRNRIWFSNTSRAVAVPSAVSGARADGRSQTSHAVASRNGMKRKATVHSGVISMPTWTCWRAVNQKTAARGALPAVVSASSPITWPASQASSPRMGPSSATAATAMATQLRQAASPAVSGQRVCGHLCLSLPVAQSGPRLVGERRTAATAVPAEAAEQQDPEAGASAGQAGDRDAADGRDGYLASAGGVASAVAGDAGGLGEVGGGRHDRRGHRELHVASAPAGVQRVQRGCSAVARLERVPPVAGAAGGGPRYRRVRGAGARLERRVGYIGQQIDEGIAAVVVCALLQVDVPLPEQVESDRARVRRLQDVAGTGPAGGTGGGAVRGIRAGLEGRVRQVRDQA